MAPVLEPHNSIWSSFSQKSEIGRAGLLEVRRVGLVYLPSGEVPVRLGGRLKLWLLPQRYITQ